MQLRLPTLPRNEEMTPEIVRFIDELKRVFPGSEESVTILRKPNPDLTAQDGIGNLHKREKA